MTVYRKPKESEAEETNTEAPHFEVEKKVITMADGKRQMIFYSFTEASATGHNGHGS